MRFSRFKITALMLVLGLMAIPCRPGSAGAQDSQSPSTGFSLWLRMPVSAVRSTTATAAGVPEFTVGYRGERYGVGVGVGLLMMQASDDLETLTGTTYQIEPSGWLDIWQSPDGRTRGSVSLGVGFGHASLEDVHDEGTEAEYSDKVSGTLWSFRLGFGGDHFLSPRFALGAEGGFQGMFGTDLKQEGDPEKVSLSASGLYGAFRSMFVF